MIKFSEKERRFNFPFPVLQSGWTSSFAQPRIAIRCPNFEVCLRLDDPDGVADDSVNGVRHRTAFPHVIFKRPGMELENGPFSNRESLFFIYSPEIAEVLTERGLLPANQLYQPFEFTGILETKVRELRHWLARSREFSAADRIDLCCFGILEELAFLNHWRSGGISEQKALLDRVASFIEMNLDSPLSIGEIAGQFGMSERTLFRRWKETFGDSPNQHLRRCRLRRAKELLETSNWAVRDIANQLCFCDDNFFSTVFRKAFGMTPRECRAAAKMHE